MYTSPQCSQCFVEWQCLQKNWQVAVTFHKLDILVITILWFIIRQFELRWTYHHHPYKTSLLFQNRTTSRVSVWVKIRDTGVSLWGRGDLRPGPPGSRGTSIIGVDRISINWTCSRQDPFFSFAHFLIWLHLYFSMTPFLISGCIWVYQNTSRCWASSASAVPQIGKWIILMTVLTSITKCSRSAYLL